MILTLEHEYMFPHHNPDIQMMLWGYAPKLKGWNCESDRSDLSWKFYWNATPGATIIRGDKRYELTPDVFCVIPSDTVFSTRTKVILDHFCIHFMVGSPFDSVSREIFLFPADDFIISTIKEMKSYTKVPNYNYLSSFNLVAHSLLYRALSMFKESDFSPSRKIDPRMKRIAKLLENGEQSLMSNETLAKMACMSVNSFIRLFTSELGSSPQKYAREKRVSKASRLLVFSDKTIDGIAAETGFVDRYHFSKIFKSVSGFSPAHFRQQHGKSGMRI